jgi:hypothetical protein
MEYSLPQPLNPLSASKQNRNRALPANQHSADRSPSKIPTQQSSPLKNEICASSLAVAHDIATPPKYDSAHVYPSPTKTPRSHTHPPKHTTSSSSPANSASKNSRSRPSSPLKHSVRMSPAKKVLSRPITPITFELCEMGGGLDKNGKFTPTPRMKTEGASGTIRPSSRPSSRLSTRPDTPLVFELQEIGGALDKNGWFTRTSTPTKNTGMSRSSSRSVTTCKVELQEIGGVVGGDRNRSVAHTPKKESASPTKIGSVEKGSAVLEHTALSPVKPSSASKEGGYTSLIPTTTKTSPSKSTTGVSKNSTRDSTDFHTAKSTIVPFPTNQTNQTTRPLPVSPRNYIPSSSSPTKRRPGHIRTPTNIAPPPAFELPTRRRAMTSSKIPQLSTSLKKLCSENTPTENHETRSAFLRQNFTAKALSFAKVDISPRRRRPKTQTQATPKSRVPVPSSLKSKPPATTLSNSARKSMFNLAPPSPSVFATPKSKSMAFKVAHTNSSKPTTPAPINSRLYQPIEHPRTPVTTLSCNNSEDDTKPYEIRIASAEHVAEMIREWKSEEKAKFSAESSPRTPGTPSKPPTSIHDSDGSHTPKSSPAKTLSPLCVPKTRTRAAAMPQTPLPSKTATSRFKMPNSAAKLRTPSKETACSLDRAIDRHLGEEGRMCSPSGLWLSGLLGKRDGAAAPGEEVV